jgi:hypothetical protein
LPCRLAPASCCSSVLARNRTGTDAQRWSHELRKLACESVTLRGQVLVSSTPPGSRTPSCSSEDCRASITLAGQTVSRPGLEPGPRPSEGRMQFLYTIRTSCFSQSRRLPCLSVANAGHQHQPVYKTGASLFGHIGNQQDREESNPVKRLWRPPALPGARSYVPIQAAPAWIGN